MQLLLIRLLSGKLTLMGPEGECYMVITKVSCYDEEKSKESLKGEGLKGKW